MADTIKALADGQLAAAKATIYTAPALTSTIVTSIILVNTGAGANAVNLYYKKSAGTSRRICPKDLSMAIGAAFEDIPPFNIEAGGLIEGDATNATEVDYVISGIEHT